MKTIHGSCCTRKTPPPVEGYLRSYLFWYLPSTTSITNSVLSRSSGSFSVWTFSKPRAMISSAWGTINHSALNIYCETGGDGSVFLGQTTSGRVVAESDVTKPTITMVRIDYFVGANFFLYSRCFQTCDVIKEVVRN